MRQAAGALPAGVIFADAGINPGVSRASRTYSRQHTPDHVAASVVESDLVVVLCCSAVVAVVVGYVDCALPARVVWPDVDCELVVAGRGTLCCKRSAERKLQVVISAWDRRRGCEGFAVRHIVAADALVVDRGHQAGGVPPFVLVPVAKGHRGQVNALRCLVVNSEKQ